MNYAPVAISCTGKRAYATATGAYLTLKRMPKRDKFRLEKGRHLNVYRCKICHQWHIGGSAF